MDNTVSPTLSNTMMKGQFTAEKLYLAARSVAESLHKAGLITEKELSAIDTKLLDIYQPSLSTLLLGNSRKIVDLS
ncbi:MAG: hypothetical protein IJ555_06080 [Ruminococcus sp.]|nr:hypothetical protein [Ruminococcus sp.]